MEGETPSRAWEEALGTWAPWHLGTLAQGWEQVFSLWAMEGGALLGRRSPAQLMGWEPKSSRL